MSFWAGVLIVIVLGMIFIVMPMKDPAGDLCFSTHGDKLELNNYCKIWGYCSCEYVENGLIVKHRIEVIDGNAYFVKEDVKK